MFIELIVNMLRELLKEIFEYRPYKIEQIDYELYWSYREQHGKKGLKLRDKIIASRIEESSSVLDVGCGNGRLLEYLITEKKVRGEGYDNSDKALEIAKRKGIPVQKVDLNSKNIPLQKVYDHIILSEVIEHIPDPEGLMNQLQDHFLKSLIVTFPNIGHFSYRLRLLTGRFPECWKWHPGEHIRFWTKKDFRYWIERKDNGFDRLYIKKMIPGDKLPELPFLDSLVARNYIVEIGKKND